jgi:hypothetical protein
MDPVKPRPHGPCTKLTIAHRGKFASRFVRADSLPEVTAIGAMFKTFRKITETWIDLAI